MKDFMKKAFRIGAVVLAMLFLCSFFFGCSVNENTSSSTELYLPWENGGKQPSEYTWEEFEALEGGQQIAFQNSFESFEEFDKWMQEAQFGTEKNPWDEKGAKQPSEYTWEEFEALSAAQQMMFQNSFESFEEFDKWMQEAQSGTEKNPWDEKGAKQPSEYTWEEFEALSAAQQMAFQNSFESLEEFDKWLIVNNP